MRSYRAQVPLQAPETPALWPVKCILSPPPGVNWPRSPVARHIQECPQSLTDHSVPYCGKMLWEILQHPRGGSGWRPVVEPLHGGESKDGAWGQGLKAQL
jgi:hypothetical protein